MSPSPISDNGHAKEVADFRNAVENLDVSTQEVDDATCLRFLKARSMHINKAAKMYVQYHAWRASFVPLGHIPAEQVAAELHADKCYLQGYTKKGSPLVVGFSCKHYANPNLDTFKRYVVHTLEKSIASAPPGVEKITAIVDLNHMGYKNMDLKGSIAMFQLLQNYYPERLAALYAVNVPRFFHSMWKVICRFLDQATKEKIVFLEHHVMAEVLLSEVDADTLPSMFGGKAGLVRIQDALVPNWPEPVSVPA
ncbi:hypothetical protein GOP47_0008084 [Adiantum capillus-veneris]|uniref:CRAL-TRIO domain-containing protein n=1 Tax=Adiantum capillus-veneris TaxID=13818 RepID=A0A9D4UY25_ADICA|nr:hypothetical protein GOP47_0008084 [Adiantum capillus-veneris]